MKKRQVDMSMFKKSPEELELYVYFKKRGFAKRNKKGKGSYRRKDKYSRVV